MYKTRTKCMYFKCTWLLAIEKRDIRNSMAITNNKQSSEAMLDGNFQREAFYVNVICSNFSVG